MLLALSIRDIVLIHALDIEFRAGLSVLTGETGAGKSILMDALSLALGARGDGTLVRDGAENGSVRAQFDLPMSHPLHQFLEENDLASEGDLIVRRVQSADGRSRAYVNDRPVSVSILRQIGKRLVEIHGQHDDRALVAPETHRDLLDVFGVDPSLLSFTQACWSAWKSKEKALKTLKSDIAQARTEADYLEAAVAELTDLSPEPGEEELLASKRQTMMEAEGLASDIAEAVELVSGSQSPMSNLSGLLRRLERKVKGEASLLKAPVEALAEALDALEVAGDAFEMAYRETEFDKNVLEQTEERLFALRSAARKYRTSVENLPDTAARLAAQLDALHTGEDRLAELEKEAAAAREEYVVKAHELRDARIRASEILSNAVNNELPELKLPNAKFIVAHEESEEKSGPQGMDTIEFWVQTNPGMKPGPMMKIASGGELSRFLLALKVALAGKGTAPSLVFDEIDTGVGGAVADAIGARLARLSKDVQVLAITHAPQVAARAKHHLLIQKAIGTSGATETGVRTIDAPLREEEIARMLAGATITQEARAAAQRLIRENASGA